MNGEAAVPKPNQGKAAIGFLTVVEHPQHGLFGGYLLLNLSGRPLEFHCTTPVKPSRAQEILYGPTLRPYLYGEQIGSALVNKAKLRPLVVCTDTPPVLSLRDFASVPVALILDEATSAPPPGDAPPDPAAAQQRQFRLDVAHNQRPGMHAFRLGRHQLGVSVSHGDDRQAILERLAGVAEQLDLNEPFARIREAIEEAQRGGGR